MKKTLVTLTATLACVAAFAQGKVGFQNDSLHLVYFNPDPSKVLAADVALAGQPTPLPTASLPSGVTLAADLYMGTASTSLTLYSSTTFDATAPGPGKWQNVAVATSNPFIAGGTSVFVEVQVRDAASAAPATFAGTAFGTYYGTSEMFKFTLGSGIQNPVLWGANGNWAPGTFNLDATAAGTGSRGAIQISTVPEPASLALCGLGVAALVIFRRRK